MIRLQAIALGSISWRNVKAPKPVWPVLALFKSRLKTHISHCAKKWARTNQNYFLTFAEAWCLNELCQMSKTNITSPHIILFSVETVFELLLQLNQHYGEMDSRWQWKWVQPPEQGMQVSESWRWKTILNHKKIWHSKRVG